MRVLARSLLALLVVGLPAGKLAAQPASTHEVTGAQYERWKTDLSNWGRWGKDDQIGALNLITPEKRKQAAGLVKEGFSVSLASDADTVKAVDNPNPYEIKMLGIGTDRMRPAIRWPGKDAMERPLVRILILPVLDRDTGTVRVCSEPVS